MDPPARKSLTGSQFESWLLPLTAFRASVSGFCTRRGMNYLFTSNQVPFEKLVLGYLRARGLLQ